MILVGTCGFQYKEWVPVFYPKSLDPAGWLRHYSRVFGCCEIGFTGYRIPETSSIQEFVDETQGGTQFVFRVPWQLAGENREDLAKRFAAALWPLKDSGQLAGALAQFPPEFGFFGENFERLRRLRDSLGGMQLIVEFGCSDWLSPKAARHLASARIALACVDENGPGKTFFGATADLAYVRFQGRNRCRWIQGDGSALHDYLYSRAELAAALPGIRGLERQSGRVLVLMNNPWRGQAVINARMLLELLKADSDGPADHSC